METLRLVAEKHGLVCLLHEKPFKGINGSGKHNNWSISSDTGVNLLDPGKSPRDNLQFLTFLCAMIKAVDKYADLLRISVASHGNDCRLGGNEAPLAVISIYLGDEIMDILKSIERGEIYTQKKRGKFEIGLNVFPAFPRDTSDRNRTSPFAFTGNKFEFRMVGSAQSIASPNMILNTIAAQSLKEFADRLEQSDDPCIELNSLLAETIKKHKKIIFNGNSYSDTWEDESQKRGLCNLKTTVDALKHSIDEKNIKLFETHKVLSRREMVSRYQIHMRNYCIVANIEAQMMAKMATSEILPAMCQYTKNLSDTIISKKQAISDIPCEYESHMLEKISQLSQKLYAASANLEKSTDNYKNIVIPAMNDVRKIADESEKYMPKKYWPYPTYEDILFSV